jgi:hypothetical protein
MRCSSPRTPEAICSGKAAGLLGQTLFFSALLSIALSNSGCGFASAGTNAITPGSAAVDAGGSVQFSVRTENSPVQVAKWLACGIVGGNSTCGTISSTGLYQAPKIVDQYKTFSITAVSADGVTQFGTTQVQVRAATGTISISPTSVTLGSQQTNQFSVTSSEASSASVRWTARLGSISSSGLYTAPMVTAQSQDTVTVSSADGSKSSSASVTVRPQLTQAVDVSVSPNSATVRSGLTTQFSAVVSGTTNTAVTWTAKLGSISSSGRYIAPTVSVQSNDTVTAVSVADGSVSASASIAVTVQGASGSAYSLQNPPPVTIEFYPGTIFTTPLPANVNSHCLGIVICGGASDISNGLAIVSNSFGGNIANAANMVITTSPTVQTGVDGHTLYYASASDPVYEFIGAAGVHVPSSSGNNPVGIYFHISNQAQFSSESSDQFLNVWDQSSDIDSTTGGRILSVYVSNGGTPASLALPGPCTCTTTSCASTTAACRVNIGEYAEYDYPFNDPNGYDASVGAYASAHFAPLAAITRQLEWSNGAINHALLLNANCMNQFTPTVFPSFGSTSPCTDGSALHVSNGSLLWIDSGYNCSSLPRWQAPFCTAMQTYGGYVIDSGGVGATGGFYDSRVENGVAWTAAGLAQPAPIFTYLNGAGTTNGLSCSGNPVNKCSFPVFNMPGLLGHLHVIDPCVPEGMAGQPGGCS